MVTLDDVREAMQLHEFDVLAAHREMVPLARVNKRPSDMPGQPRIGAVLLLLYCKENRLHLVLTERRADLSSHAGQISFPGGRREDAETLQVTALRETHEEIGVPPTAVTILGQMTDIYIPPSDYEVHPFVGWYHNGKRPSFQPSVTEVAQILEVPLSHLMHPDTRKSGPWQFRGMTLTVPYFDVEGHMVWGATAIMLSELLGRLALVTNKKQ
jgi:8-oxo-dGTP pyrophosphatase MutT (NUDIX family)